MRKLVKLIRKGIGMKVSQVRPESKCKVRKNNRPGKTLPSGGTGTASRNPPTSRRRGPKPLDLQAFRTAVTGAWLFAAVIPLFKRSYLL